MDGGGTKLVTPSTVRLETNGRDEQQQPRPVIRWERFLPRRSLRVLLVEHDDSTRHIVTALLRKCSYHVAAVADGLKAWEILKEKIYRFDLVLTEVEMPLLSGISLLSKIMGCELSKNIPVIMMSSHDSVNVVYKCMLKGAVDFLVKPVRRNELRNLWQHVWRKHCSSTFFNGPQSINNSTIKSKDLSDNNAASNHIREDVDSGSKNKESQDGSDTQSSGSKPQVDLQHVEGNGEPILINHTSSSTPVESKIEKPYSSELVPEDELKIHDSGTERNKIVKTQVETFPTEKCQEQNSFYAKVSSRGEHLIHKEEDDCDFRSPAQNSLTDKPSKQIIDFIGAADNGECSYTALEKDDVRGAYQLETRDSFSITHGSTADALPSWELSLRGPELIGFSNQDSQERNILKRSAASAFSRYCTGINLSCQKSEPSFVTLSITTKVNDYGNHVADNEQTSLPPARRLASFQGNKTEEIIHHQVSSASNNNYGSHSGTGPPRKVSEDACMTNPSMEEDKNQTLTLPGRQLGLLSHPFPVRGLPFQNLCGGYGAIMHPLYYPDSLAHRSGGIEMPKDPRPVEHDRCGNHVIYNLPSTVFQQSKEGSHSCPSDRRTERIENEELRDCRDFTCSDAEQNNCGCSQNNLNCGRSNGTCGITDAACSAGITAESRDETGLWDNEKKESCRDHSRREAALLKFRQKRKDRCFEKKVRYHSRKKLAEQRPRIKGQFVRQSAIEVNTMIIEEDE